MSKLSNSVNLLNSSTSKQRYSFSKSPRFRELNKSMYVSAYSVMIHFMTCQPQGPNDRLLLVSAKKILGFRSIKNCLLPRHITLAVISKITKKDSVLDKADRIWRSQAQ